ncbi:cation-transporting P-type ATPase [Leptolyngbya sp. FACHB-321]|uniref:cation-translocating P-type ATPase n=1 Tax=Leptolyngbya sp. FACHB-321 TaxID=2692807 RepID=UPI001684579E|nr:cation-transporting P-type ATPase [Leptolyngbya sp. FACHB-321]MBD2038108.1 cation-transporting P-type ATPase [Leptolyngbya sp. FACHB-321]
MTVKSSSPGPALTWHTLGVRQTLEQFQTDRQSGLTSQQVTAQLEQYGTNELIEAGGRSTWEILLDQFTNIMLLLLIAVALISGVLDFFDWRAGKLSPGEIPFKDTIAIIAIVILNGLLGYFQESKAEKDLAALKKLASSRVRVIRDGKTIEVDSKELVPGDVMLLEAGVQVAADGRLIEASNLQIRESALTGEAQAVSKRVETELPAETPLGDRINLVYQGTEVLQGRAAAIVTGTGMQTELGRIATMLQSVEAEATPLQKRMALLSKVLVTGALLLVALVVLGGIGYATWQSGKNLLEVALSDVGKEYLEVSLSMAVAIVPEGLPAVITVTLALGTQRMVKRQALIRKLPAVETLGSVTTICSDKTGTLTQNKMVVQLLHTSSTSLRVTGDGYSPTGAFAPVEANAATVDPQEQPELLNLLTACTVCNDAVLQEEKGSWIILGDPTEGALLTLAGKAGFEKDQWASKLPRVAEFPFSSERKRMSAIVEVLDTDPTLTSDGSHYIMFTKGSPELILERCTQIQVGDAAQPIAEEQRRKVLEQNNQMAGRGLRVLGFACKPLTAIPPEGSDEVSERELVWLGLVAMLDAPRPEVRDAVARCRSAGIRPVMITGDHQLTAQAVAEDLGIAKPGDRALTGNQLEHLSLEELANEVEDVSVYARVAPEHKLRIVQVLQRKGHVVAMTGDGVNDAPALKQADIGIAMGITGTDVSKDASDMVLLDDNFATIVAATEEGRVVYTNIRRFIKYILGSNIGELLTIAAAPLLGLGGVPLSPLQILWMNLVTDGLPALALAVEPAEPDVMRRPPHDPGESIFARGLGAYMIRIGIVLAILAIALMSWAYGYTHANPTAEDPSGDRWKTMVFTTLCIAQMGHALAIRSNTRLTIELNPLTNPFLLGAVVVTSLLQLALVYVPFLRSFFNTHYLSGFELGVCLGVSVLMFVWVELEKLVFRWYAKTKK